MRPIISLDEWTPERPPKNPLLRVPSPELPPPPSPSTNKHDHLDDPLPPPPLEILCHSSAENKLNTANRRNSFAGSSTYQKPFIRSNIPENSSPPLLPRKPNSIELFNPRPFSSMRQPRGFQVKQTNKINNVVMNGRLERSNGTANSQSPVNRLPPPPSNNNNINNNDDDNRLSIRKRAHNAPMSLASPDEIRNR